VSGRGSPQLSLTTNRFELRERLGQGGAGVVYEAFDREHMREVALKVLPDMSGLDIQRLKHEFRALTDVAHPNLVRLHELVSDGGQWFFTMELVRGTTFLEVVRTADHLPPENVAELETRPLIDVARADTISDGSVIESYTRATAQRISGRPRIPELRSALAQLAQGVAAIHAAGKLHCDLKPQNVLVTRDGRVVVLDFGLVADVRGPRAGEPAGMVSGTPAYMSPEQASGEPLSEATDWYALGVMLYEALTGRLPFDGPMLELMRLKQVSDPPPPDLLASDLPEDLCTLATQLLQRDPKQRPSGRDILNRLCGNSWAGVHALRSSSVPATPHRSALVGREHELSQLNEALAFAMRKQPVTVYVRGNAGIGKSRLLREFLDGVAQKEGNVVLAGRCYERELLPFKAFDSVIDALTTHLLRLRDDEAAALLPRDVHSLARLFPVLLRVPAIAHAKRPAFEAPDPHALRARAFAAVKELLARIAEAAPLVVHIDDLHWGDVDSASLLIELLEPPNPPAMLFIASFRSADADASPFLRTLLSRFPAGGSSVRDIPIEPLSARESLALVQSFQSALRADATARHAQVIADEAAGNPFFVAQLVHYLASTYAQAANDGQMTADGVQAALPRSSEPITLELVLRERLSHLPEPALALLEVLAVAGRPIACDLAVEASGIASEADNALSLLRAGSWLRSQGPRKDDAVECYHDRVREVVAQTLPAARLRTRHARIAVTLELSGRASPVDLAEHFRAAEQNDKAVHYAQRAAEKATYALAFDDAAHWYELALSLGTLDASERSALRIKLGESLANAGRTAAAAQTFLAAAAHAAPDRVLELRRRAAEQWIVGGHIDEGVTALRSVLDAVSMRLAKTPQRALASLVVQRARVKVRGLRWQRREHADVPPELLMRIDTCWSVATGFGTIDTIRAADFQARHLLLALSAGEPYRVARALAVEAGFVATSGRKGRARAEELSAAALALALELEHEQPHALGLAKTTSGMKGYLMGEWRQATRDCDEAERILLERCTGVLWELTNARRFALSSLMFMGHIAQLAPRAQKLLTDARERGHLFAETDLRARLLTLVWLAQDKVETAADNADDALGRWTQQGFHLQHYNHLLALAQCDLYRGDAPAALGRLEAGWPQLERSMLLRIQALRAEIWYARGRALLGALASLQGSAHAARTAELGRIAQLLEREGMPWTDALATQLRAGLHAQRGEQDAARRELERAATAFNAVDMDLHAACARERLGVSIGGTHGAEMRASATRVFDAQGVVNREAMMQLYVPGMS
jgi:serine/threonine protein kinase